MSRNVILVAETGSDLTPQMANKIGAYLVPMHVSMGGETYDDGAFPPEDVCAYYDRTGKVPQTSAANPGDFAPVFDEIHAKHPEAKILHLAYSAVTTCSYQSAVIAAEDRDYVVSVDTKHVSVGQGVVVREVARVLEENPGMTVEEALLEVDRFLDNAVLCGLERVTLIHGKGTGALRAGIQQHLKQHKQVNDFRLGVYGEGETGVTIVELK